MLAAVPRLAMRQTLPGARPNCTRVAGPVPYRCRTGGNAMRGVPEVTARIAMVHTRP